MCKSGTPVASSPRNKHQSLEDIFITEVKKEVMPIEIPEKKNLKIFKPLVQKTEKPKVCDVQEYIPEDKGEESEAGRFLATSRGILLAKDLDKKKHGQDLKIPVNDWYRQLKDEEKSSFEKLPYEKKTDGPTDDFPELKRVQPGAENIEEYPEEKIDSTFTSPDSLEEHSKQLRGQVIVYVKKRLHDFEIGLYHIDKDLFRMENKIHSLQNLSNSLQDKLSLIHTNFSKRDGDIAVVKEMANEHQVSIVNIMHLLDRKAEAYAVNQKVSRKEMTVIEDRVLKLCVTASTEITKLEEKIDDSLEKIHVELDKKLFIEEFELRLEFLLHRLKTFETKLKDISIGTPVLDFEGIRPVEIKKYVIGRDGIQIKQDKRKVANWNWNAETSPKTAMQVQKELELASYRDSKRYVEGAYTKIKVGKK